MNSPEHSAKGLFIGVFSSVREIQTVVNLGNVEHTQKKYSYLGFSDIYSLCSRIKRLEQSIRCFIL